MVGAPKEIGIYTAIFPGFLYSFLGSSRMLSVGPLATAVVIMYESLKPFNLNSEQLGTNMILMTFCIGLTLTVCGLFKLGFIENIFAQPVNSAYLSAVAIVLMVDQFSKCCLISLKRPSPIEKIFELIFSIGNTHVPSFLITVLILFLFFSINY